MCGGPHLSKIHHLALSELLFRAKESIFYWILQLSIEMTARTACLLEVSQDARYARLNLEDIFTDEGLLLFKLFLLDAWTVPNVVLICFL